MSDVQVRNDPLLCSVMGHVGRPSSLVLVCPILPGQTLSLSASA